ncbi:MAG: hypothetical protein AAB449_00950 [Patescibacteria group bacterium]
MSFFDYLPPLFWLSIVAIICFAYICIRLLKYGLQKNIEQKGSGVTTTLLTGMSWWVRLRLVLVALAVILMVGIAVLKSFGAI